MRKPFHILCSALVVFVLLVSCETKKQTIEVNRNDKLKVVATIFPLYDFARLIGGEAVDVSLLIPPGTEPHSFDPRPENIVSAGRAAIFVYTNDTMEPWAGSMLKGLSSPGLVVVQAGRGIALTEEHRPDDGHDGHRHGHEDAPDPHIWLDFDKARKMVDTIVESFISVNPAKKELYLGNAKKLKDSLAGLDQKFSAALKTCKHNTIVHGGHFAFGYLAKRYGLKYISASGFSPDAEPSPQNLVRMSKTLKKEGLKHIFYEELVTSRMAEVIAKETGASLLLLHGGHNISKQELDNGTAFISLMERNLDNIKEGLQCRR
ncbi:MAG: zinc-binding protein [Nitrospirae bacterium]|nr:MAG: zinc-binding protein [Nitrospirota bacterium]